MSCRNHEYPLPVARELNVASDGNSHGTLCRIGWRAMVPRFVIS